MKLFFCLAIFQALSTVPVLGSQALGRGQSRYGRFDVIVNGNVRIGFDYFSISKSTLMKGLPADAWRVESAFIDNSVRDEDGSVQPLYLSMSIACVFYWPWAEESNQYISDSFGVRIPSAFGFSGSGRQFEPLELSPQASPFLTSQLVCFTIDPDSAKVLIGSSFQPVPIAMEKSYRTYNGRRIWEQRGSGNFLGRKVPDPAERFLNEIFGTGFGTQVPSPITVSKAALAWPQRESITCFLVKGDEQAPPVPFRAGDALISPTEDVVGFYCEEEEQP